MKKVRQRVLDTVGLAAARATTTRKGWREPASIDQGEIQKDGGTGVDRETAIADGITKDETTATGIAARVTSTADGGHTVARGRLSMTAAGNGRMAVQIRPSVMIADVARTIARGRQSLCAVVIAHTVDRHPQGAINHRSGVEVETEIVPTADPGSQHIIATITSAVMIAGKTRDADRGVVRNRHGIDGHARLRIAGDR